MQEEALGQEMKSSKTPNTVEVVFTFNSFRPHLPLKIMLEERRYEQERKEESLVLSLQAMHIQVIQDLYRQGESVRQDAG